MLGRFQGLLLLIIQCFEFGLDPDWSVKRIWISTRNSNPDPDPGSIKEDDNKNEI